MKVIKVGLYRYASIISITALLISVALFGYDWLYALSLGAITAWVIFEMWVNLQAVLGIQQMLILILQEGRAGEKSINTGSNKVPSVRLVDDNASKGQAEGKLSKTVEIPRD